MNKQTYREVLPWIETDSDLPWLITSDVTSRDWLQSLAWYNYWTSEQRANLSILLSELWIHHIELGFPAVKDDPEYDAVKYAADQIWDRDTVVMWLARLVEDDVTNTIEALSWSKYRGVHTFIWTSPKHLQTFSLSTSEILKNIWDRVSQIREAGCIAQFSAEDATRTDFELLVEVYEKALSSWAQILNIPDTVWFFDTIQYIDLLKHLRSKFPDAIFSTHAHNDKSQAEQSALVAASLWYAQRIEWTIYGIWERAWNTDIMAIVYFILHDKRYSSLANKLINDPDKFTQVLEYMTEISWIHSRPVSPWYWHEAIVNRSWIHQAKVAKIKDSYIAFPWDIVWLWDRPKIELSALSWYNWVMSKFLDDFWIEIDSSLAKKLAHLYRLILSPDTEPHQIHEKFPDLSDKFLYDIWKRVDRIREEAHSLKNSKENIIRWQSESDSIVIDVYNELSKNWH